MMDEATSILLRHRRCPALGASVKLEETFESRGERCGSLAGTPPREWVS